MEKKNYHYNNHDSVDAQPLLSSTASMEISQPLPPPDNGLEGVDCMDLMETFGYMDLVECNDFFDPSCIFHNDFQQDHQQEHDDHHQLLLQSNNNNNGEIGIIHEDQKDQPADDMATVFLEWLRTNKESVSAEDLRSVRIKKATIECAAKRLGGGKEAMKQLLKLVLEWVQTNHLHKRRTKELLLPPTNFHIPNQYNYQDLLQNPNPNESNPNPCFTTQQSQWIPQPPPPYPSMVGYMGDPYTNGQSPYPAPTEYHHMQLDSSQSWPSSQFTLVTSHYNTFPDNNIIHPAPPQAFGSYGNHQYPYHHHQQQYFNGHGERLVRLGSSATKEARKKRMARQRRFLSHHRHGHHNHHNQHQNQNTDQQHARLGNDNCTTAAAAAAQAANPGNWVYWPSAPVGAASPSPVMPVEVALGLPADRTAMQPQNLQGRVAQDRRQVG